LCASSSPCFPLLLFTGAGPAKRSRPHYLRPNEEGIFEDEVSIRRKQHESVRKVKATKYAKKAARDAKKAAQANKGKSPRVNYKTMSSVSYSALRQNDWYATQPRLVHIEDRRFWCPEQLYIFQDIFAPMRKLICPMHPIDLGFLKSKEYFVPAVQVVERLGLTGLMTFQCEYDPQLIM
jgi:hypothetical protein